MEDLEKVSEAHANALEAIRDVDLEEVNWKIHARAKRMQEIDVQIAELQQERARLNNLNRRDQHLVNVFRSEIPSKAEQLLSSAVSDKLKEMKISEACQQILTEVNEPLHINVIVQIMKRGGFIFRADDPSDSVEATLRKEPGLFEKVGVRTYKLKGKEA
jgi:hypothetical protein